MGRRVPRESCGVSPVIIGTLEDPLRIKRFSSIAVGIGGIAVSQIAQLIGTAYLESRVSDLEHRIDAVNLESIRARERLGEDISVVAKAVDLNTAFDEQG